MHRDQAAVIVAEFSLLFQFTDFFVFIFLQLQTKRNSFNNYDVYTYKSGFNINVP